MAPPVSTSANGTEARPVTAGPPQWAIPLAALALTLALLWRLQPNDPYASFAFAGGAVIFLSTAPTRRGLLLTAAGVPGLSFLYYGLHGADSPSEWAAVISIAAGSAAIGASAFLAIAAPARLPALRRLAAVGAMPAFVIVAAIVLNRAVLWTPLTFDSTLSGVDRSFGFDPSFAAGNWVAGSRTLWWTSKLVYDSLPLALCVVAAARSRRFGDDDSTNVLASTIVASGVALLLFQLLPACGPRFFWGSRFPFDPPAPGQVTLGPTSVVPSEFRNALPSLHLSGALFAAWALKPFRLAWRLAAWSYVVFTVIATLGSGQHYLIDLVVAVPFALGIELSVRQRRINVWSALLFAIVILWLTAIRWFSTALMGTRGLTTGASVATILLVAWLVPQLEALGVRDLRQRARRSLASLGPIRADQGASSL